MNAWLCKPPVSTVTENKKNKKLELLNYIAIDTKSIKIKDYEYMGNWDISICLDINWQDWIINEEIIISEDGNNFSIYVYDWNWRVLLPKNHPLYQKIRHSNILARKIYELIEGKKSKISTLLDAQ